MIKDGLGLAEPELRLVWEWLERNPQNDAMPLETARAMALRQHGGDRRSEGPCNASLKYGTAAHWQARLRRDRPDLAERVETGELSANAAAIEAGFRHRRTPFEVITRLITKLDAAERARLKEILEEEDMSEAGEQHGQRQRLKMALEGTQ
jgi:hypothetical protein